MSLTLSPNAKKVIAATAIFSIVIALFFTYEPFDVSMTCDKCEAVMNTLIKAIETDQVDIAEAKKHKITPKYLSKVIYHACDTHFFQNGTANDIWVCRVYLDMALGFIDKSLKENRTAMYICYYHELSCYENATVSLH